MATNVAMLLAKKMRELGPERAFETAEAFPDATAEEVLRAFAIVRGELDEEVAAEQRALDQMQLAGTVFDGLENQGLTLGQAATIKAAQGDAVAIALLAKLNSRPCRLGTALFEAAAEAHPGWERVDRGYRWMGVGEPPTVNATIDWFQMTHPGEAAAIELAIDGNTAGVT